MLVSDLGVPCMVASLTLMRYANRITATSSMVVVITVLMYCHVLVEKKVLYVCIYWDHLRHLRKERGTRKGNKAI